MAVAVAVAGAVAVAVAGAVAVAVAGAVAVAVAVSLVIAGVDFVFIFSGSSKLRGIFRYAPSWRP